MAEREEKISNQAITVVIGTLNRPQVVMQLLKQLAEQMKLLSFQVLVFDQSTHENYLELQKIFPTDPAFRLIRMTEPNTCKYLNFGWQQASAPIVLYLDDDVTITPQTIPAHLKAFDNPQTMGVAGRVLNDNEKVSTDSRVGRVLSYGAVITKNFSFEKETTAQFPYGCNMSFRKTLLQKLNGFDEKLHGPIYAYNEIDLGYRIDKKWPNSIRFIPEAFVNHHQYPSGGTRTYTQRQASDSIQFNYGYFLGKNFNWLENILCLLRRSIYQLTHEPGAIPHIVQGIMFGKESKHVD